MFYCLGIGLSCMEKPNAHFPAEKVSCDPGMDTCLEALGIGIHMPTTYQGCASTGSGFKAPQGMFNFNLNANDVKKNGCMSREEIQKKLDKNRPQFNGDIDNIKICFCDCGDCCNQGIKNDGSCSSCPIEVTTKKGWKDKVFDLPDKAGDAIADKLSSGISFHVVTKDNTFFPSKIILIACLLAILFG